VLIFLISALRSVIEMLGLCLLGQATLYIFSGENRRKNPIYQFFSLLTRGPRHIAAQLLPGNPSAGLVAAICFLLLFILWIALAWLRKSL